MGQRINGATCAQRHDHRQRQDQHRNGTNGDLERLGTGTIDHVEDTFGVLGNRVMQRLVDQLFFR